VHARVGARSFRCNPLSKICIKIKAISPTRDALYNPTVDRLSKPSRPEGDMEDMGEMITTLYSFEVI
jgi:hypothetical protein